MLRVLVVEDEDIPRKGLVHMVDWAELGCGVAGEAADGEEGLGMIARLRPDIVVTDVKMPVVDGIEMLRRSKEEYRYEALIVSGYDEFQYARQAISLGVSDYLLKPIDMDAFSATIRKMASKIEESRGLQWYSRSGADGLVPGLFAGGPPRARNRNVRAALDYIEAHYPEKIGLEDACREIGVSCSYLGELFKRETGGTFTAQLNRRRLLRSIELLRRGELRVYEIAEAVGFSDYKYFAQVFKKTLGCSPHEFLGSRDFE